MTMRKMPRNIAALFLFITLFRVASFASVQMQAGWILGTAFSAGLGLAVYLSSYNMRVWGVDKSGDETRQSKDSRRTALAALIVFGVIDGLFNLWDVQMTVKDTKLQTAAFIYGVFPTAAAGLLGWLQGKVDKLPLPPQKARAAQLTAGRVVVAWFAKVLRIDVSLLQTAQQQDAVPAITVEAPAAAVIDAQAQPAQLTSGAGERAQQSAEAAQPVTINCLDSTCSETFTADTLRSAIAKRSAHMRWKHQNKEQESAVIDR